MVDNLDAQSTASSDISDSLRELILGLPRRRKKEQGVQSQSVVVKENKSQNTLISNEFPPKEKIGDISRSRSDALAGRQNLGGSQMRGENGSLGPTRKESSSLSYHTAEGSGGTLRKSGSQSQRSQNLSASQIQRNQNLSASLIQKNQNLSGSQIQRKQNLSGESLLLIEENLSTEKGDRFERILSGQMNKTQTVAVQTEVFGDVGGCKCTCGEHEYMCTDCRCQNSCCKKKTPRKKCYGDYDETDFSNDNFTDNSSRTEIKIRHKKRSQYTCNCRNCVDFDTEEASDSEDSCSTEFNDLPYQNNEEYLKLLRELEKKLMARNRDRVRKTMMEFERRSRLNQNLDKPVYDYSDDNATILQKLSPPKEKRTRCRCKCGGTNETTTNSDIMQNEKRWEEVGVAHETVLQASESCHPNNRIERSLHKSHWQLDPRSGEWVKVSSFQHTDFARPPGGGKKKECSCKQRKRY